MHWKRFCLVSLSLAWMAFPARVRAQDPTSTPGYSTVDNLSGAMTLTPGGGSYLLFNKQTGRAVGIPTGYSRIGIRHAIFEDGPHQVFGDAHFLITDTSRYGFNTGIGYRTMIDGAIWGVNGFYDNIQSPESHTYQQGGVGFEYLSDSFDFRANGYVPFGNREEFLKVVDPGTTPVFVGHDFSTLGTALFQQALAGWDAEAGVPMPVINWLRGYAGVYYLTFKGDETWGVRGRFEGRVTQGIDVSVQVSNDQQFGTNINVGVDVRFDGRMPSRFGVPADAYARRYDQVRRQWQVQLGTNKGDYAVPLNDPTTGEQIVVSWVNNTAGPGGDGTVERPYNVLPSSVDSDYVLVQRGVGDTVGNIVLNEGQDLFGEGKQHFINTDRLGLTAIPDAYFDNTGSFPTLRAGNLNAPVVTLADGSQVRGFDIFGGNTAAIAGTGTDNFLVECVNVTSASGLSIVDGGGFGIVRDASFVNTAAGGVGVSISNTSGSALNLTIDDVQTSGGAIGTSILAQGAPVTLNLTNYTGSNHTNAGIILDAVGSTLGANVADTTLTNVGDGVRLNASVGGTVNGNINRLTATGSGNLLEGNVNTGTLSLSVVDSNLSGSTGGSGVSLNLTNASGVAFFDNLTADGNAVDGQQAVAIGTTDYRVELHDSSLVGNVDDATDNSAFGGATLVVVVDPTDLSNSGDNAVEFEANGANSRVVLDYDDITAVNSGNDGINGLATNGGRADITADNVIATGSGRNGLNLVASNGGIIGGLFNDSSFSQSTAAGGHVEATGNSTVALNFNRTPMADNGTTGLEYLTNGGSQFSAAFVDGDLSRNPVNNVIGTTDGAGSRTILTFNNTHANSLAANGGFVASVTNGGDLFGTWTDSNVSGTQGDGVRTTGTGAGTVIDLSFNNSLIENNLGNGLIASLTGGDSTSSLGIDLNDSTLVNNGLDGLNVMVDGTDTTGVVAINSTPITDNNRDGFEYNVSGGADFTASALGAGNDFSNNGVNAIRGNVTGAGSTSNVTINGANVDGSGGSGVLLTVADQGQSRFSLTNSSNLGSGAHGVEALATTNGQLDLILNAVNIQNSARNGLTIDALTGGDVTGSMTGGSLSNNGQSVASSGARMNVNGAGSTANFLFNGVPSNSNSLHGFQLNSSAGGSLTARMNSGVAGATTANNNAGDGIQLTANGAGSVANLLMFGDGSTDGNGGNGLTVAGVNAEQVAVQFTGGSSNNGGDGINVSLSNVANAALELTSVGGATIENNGNDGIEIDLLNTDLTDLTVDGTLVESMRIANFTIQNNGGDGISIQTVNSNLGDGVIEDNFIADNAGNGIAVDLSTGGNLAILNNEILSNDGFGIRVTQDSDLSNITIDGNSVISNTLGNIIVDLSGTAVSELHIDNNEVDGDGVIKADIFTEGLNFLGSTLNDTGEIPPDITGAVGANHIVEIINGSFAIYDKTTGALISQTSLDTFWLSAGLPTVQTGTFDPRLIFDAASGRWFASSLDAPANASLIGNNILVAVSETSDPTGNWTAFRFRADLEAQTFNDFLTMGIDENALYFTTANLTINGVTSFEYSAYSIPLTDLLAPVPTIANLNRMEDNFSFFGGEVRQPAIDFNTPNSQISLLGADETLGFSLTRNTIFTFNGTSILGGQTNITVPLYQAPLGGRQPGAPNVENDSARFGSNIVNVNGSLWAAHAIRGVNNNSVIRWYQIDEATNTVIQSGEIQDPNLDFYYPSIAVNDQGTVVIGYSGSGPGAGQFISSMASYGVTDAGITAFSAPRVLAAGVDNYNVVLGGTRNRWGEAGATIVDPTDPNKFWTFQQRVSGTNTFGVQITEINFEHIDPVSGTTTGDAIAVSVSDNAQLLATSSINNNTVTGHGGDGIRVNLNDNGAIDDLTIDGNTVTDNAGNGIGFLTTGTPSLGNLSISGSPDVANNGGDGINIQLTDVTGTPNVNVDGNNVHDNGGLGIAIDGIDTSLGVVSMQGNTVADNTGGDGLRVNLSSTTGAHVLDRVLVGGNIINNNAGDGVEIDLHDLNVTTDAVVTDNIVGTNAGRGIFVDVLNTDINDVVASFNTVNGNTGGPGISVLLNNTTGGLMTADQVVMQGNSVTNNAGTGVEVLLNNISNQTEVTVEDSQITDNAGAGFALTSNNTTIAEIALRRNTISDNTGGDGVLFDLNDSVISSALELEENSVSSNAGNGVNLDLDNTQINSLNISGNNQGSQGVAGTLDVSFTNLIWSTFIRNNSTAGMDVARVDLNIAPVGQVWRPDQTPFNDRFEVTGASDLTVGLQSINGINVVAGTNPLQTPGGATLANGGVPINSTALSFTFDDFNRLESFDYSLAHSVPGGNILSGTTLAGSTMRVTLEDGRSASGVLSDFNSRVTQVFAASAAGISANDLNGIRLAALNGSSIGSLNIDNNQIQANQSNGIEFIVQDSMLPALPERINVSENTISGNTQSGFVMVLPDTDSNSFGINFVDNTITNNTGGAGVDIQLDDNAGATFESSFTGNTISGNGDQGVNLDLSQNIAATVDDFSDNTVSDNLGIGLRVDASDNSQFSLVMGATGHNTLENNLNAGLGVTMNGNTQGQLTVLDSEFNGTGNNGLDPNFTGQGIGIRITDNALLPNLVIGDPVAGTSGASNNASHGVQIFVDGFSQLTNPSIQNMTINENGGDGINIERRGLGVIDNFVINANSLNANRGDGFDIQARAGNLLDEYTITNNTINNSTGRGIAFRVDGDADMSTQLNGNTITNNGQTGITVDSTVNAVTDTPTFTGTWLASTITGNVGHGVDINSPNHVIQVGDATAGFPDTVISNNTGNGVLIRSTGTLDIDNARINNNGGTGVLFNGGTNGVLTVDQSEVSGNAGHGVDLTMNGNTLAVTNSRIASNTLNGIRVNSVAGVNDVTLTNNVVTLNEQDGLEIINNSAAGFTALVTNSQFTSNENRGVAIFNRGSGQANITFDDNQVVSNLLEGVYVVNTADADQNTRAASTVLMERGGLVTANPDLIFAMNRNTVSANGLNSGFTATGLVMRVGTADGGLFDHTNDGGFAATRAGVTATVRDNILQGNAGSDVFFQSFVSTVNPTASTGTWDNGSFALATYQTDPLARLDLIYGNNVADSTDATTIGAAYTNDEAVFKSRTTGQAPAGPFTNANRARNAQRLADRDVAAGGTLLPPTLPTVQPNYLFPGMGASTFRVQLEPGNVFGTGSGFLLDGTPFVDLTDYNGVGAIPELWGWGTLP